MEIDGNRKGDPYIILYVISYHLLSYYHILSSFLFSFHMRSACPGPLISTFLG